MTISSLSRANLVFIACFFAWQPIYSAKSLNYQVALDRLAIARDNRQEYEAINLKKLPVGTSLIGSNPQAIAIAVFGMKEPIEGKFRQTVELSQASNRRAVVILTQLGLPDDSVRGLRYRLEFQREGTSRWRMIWAGRQQSCRPGRGHQDWRRTPCN
jgi:hypothetical protein